MTNIDKLRQAIIDAANEVKKTMAAAKSARSNGDAWRADMLGMDADFAYESRMKLAGKLLAVLNRQAEIEAFEKRREIQIDVMLYDVPATGSLDEWWDFMHDETNVVTDPIWNRWS